MTLQPAAPGGKNPGRAAGPGFDVLPALPTLHSSRSLGRPALTSLAVTRGSPSYFLSLADLLNKA